MFSSLDRVAEALPAVRVVGVPVGGFPPDISWSTIKGSAPPEQDVRTPAFAVNNKLYNATLSSRCAAALGAESYKCGVPHIGYAFLTTPTFIIQSLTDVVIMCGFEGAPCDPVEKALLNPAIWGELNQYGHNATSLISSTVATSKRDEVFAASCLLHTVCCRAERRCDGVRGEGWWAGCRSVGCRVAVALVRPVCALPPLCVIPWHYQYYQSYRYHRYR